MKGTGCYTWPTSFKDTMMCATFAEANQECPCAEWRVCKTSCEICNRPRSFEDTLTCIPYAEAGVDCPCVCGKPDNNATH